MKTEKAVFNWSSPPIQGDFNSPENFRLIAENILDPAERHIKEFMAREPFIEIARSLPVVDRTFEDMGNCPVRFSEAAKPSLNSSSTVNPFMVEKENGGLVSRENPEYFSKGLLQISQRLKPGQLYPKFETKIKQDGGCYLMQVSMTEFDTDAFEIEVTRSNA